MKPIGIPALILAASLALAQGSQAWAATPITMTPESETIELEFRPPLLADAESDGYAEVLAAMIIAPVALVFYNDRILARYEPVSAIPTGGSQSSRAGSTLWGLQLGVEHWLEVTPHLVQSFPLTGTSSGQTASNGPQNSFLLDGALRISPGIFGEEYLFDFFSPYLAFGGGYAFGGPYTWTAFVKGGVGLKLAFGMANGEVIYRWIGNSPTLGFGVSLGFSHPQLCGSSCS